MGKVRIQVDGYEKAHRTQRLEKCLELFSYLIHAKLYSESREDKMRRFQVYQGYISEVMQNCFLSDWLELYVHIIISFASGELKKPQTEFFKAVSCIHTDAFRQELLKQQNQRDEYLKSIKTICSATSTVMFFNLHTIVDKTEQAQAVSDEYEMSKNYTLPTCLIVAKIAHLIEQKSVLPGESLQNCLSYLTRDPFRFIGELSKILKDFVVLNAGDEEQEVSAKLDKAIHDTLKLLGFEEEDSAAVDRIRETLFTSGIVTFRAVQAWPLSVKSEIYGPSCV